MIKIKICSTNNSNVNIHFTLHNVFLVDVDSALTLLSDIVFTRSHTCVFVSMDFYSIDNI